MYEDLRLGRERINLDNLPTEMPGVPNVPIRREGLFGKPNPLDKAHEDRLHIIHDLAQESAYAITGMTVLGVFGRETIVKGVQMMEASDRNLPEGSLAREVGEKLTEITSQILAQGSVAIIQNYTQSAIGRIKRS